MQRRDFLSSSFVAGLSVATSSSSLLQGAEKTTAADDVVAAKSVFFGHPVVSGPAPESLTILQAVNGPASGYLELAIGEGDFQRIDAEAAGLLPYDANVFKFVLPPLPDNESIRYRITARTITFKTDYNIIQGEASTGPTYTFRTLNSKAESTKFVVWNDTHEHQETIKILQQQTAALKPDFLMWNGDQTNNVHDPVRMREQFLSPGELEICSRWPMAYSRGNHDVRGPGARQVHQFTGTPDDRFYYAFRSGPVAALVMDTGEDKPDDRAVFAGLAGFEAMRERQKIWLAQVITEPWFRSAPFRILFCHIPLWWNRDVSKYDFWIFSEVCRDAWLPLLKQADVKIVISGHVHSSNWIPANENQAIGQLTGGGPQTNSATIIQGIADQHTLRITCQSLDGKILYDLKFEA